MYSAGRSCQASGVYVASLRGFSRHRGDRGWEVADIRNHVQSQAEQVHHLPFIFTALYVCMYVCMYVCVCTYDFLIQDCVMQK